MPSLIQVISKKQNEYYQLQAELKELIPNAIGLEVKHNGRDGTIHAIFTDGTADVGFVGDDYQDIVENVKISELT